MKKNTLTRIPEITASFGTRDNVNIISRLILDTILLCFITSNNKKERIVNKPNE